MGISSSKESERTTLRRPIPIGSPSLDSTFHIDYAVEEGGIPVTFYLEDSSYTDVSVSAWKEGSEFEAYQYPMKLSKSDGGFLLVANLEPGLYLYKYNADGKWIHSKSEPSKNNNGEIVNVMLVNEGNIITNLLDSESDDYISDIDQTIGITMDSHVLVIGHLLTFHRRIRILWKAQTTSYPLGKSTP
eukprot:TRINITY_DN2070_c0_g1_i1.p1 TRINITY_DN2070_c0_g1~~TRINITY_DN2070_c0_g1_i1.p1  ORF type:complete len:188 (-),score=23.88 TRINITY_DN2070_c0_g1_i1:139-702(-)